jgi:hypothetical protein
MHDFMFLPFGGAKSLVYISNPPQTRTFAIPKIAWIPANPSSNTSAVV